MLYHNIAILYHYLSSYMSIYTIYIYITGRLLAWLLDSPDPTTPRPFWAENLHHGLLLGSKETRPTQPSWAPKNHRNWMVNPWELDQTP